MPSGITVLLYELAGPALLFPAETGINYRNQTGGYACYQSEIEGYIVPIAGERNEFLAALNAHFTGPKWGGWCSDGIDEPTAVEIDQLFRNLAHREEIAVDREKLNDSWESWIHVKINGPLLSLVEHSAATSAVLTWPNSD